MVLFSFCELRPVGSRCRERAMDAIVSIVDVPWCVLVLSRVKVNKVVQRDAKHRPWSLGLSDAIFAGEETLQTVGIVDVWERQVGSRAPGVGIKSSESPSCRWRHRKQLHDTVHHNLCKRWWQLMTIHKSCDKSLILHCAVPFQGKDKHIGQLSSDLEVC